jgi:hypothetical protein
LVVLAHRRLRRAELKNWFLSAGTFTAVGMQALVDAIRSTGATQPIMVGGLTWASDLSGWTANEPSDPLGQLVASFHSYNYGNTCPSGDWAGCENWNGNVLPVATNVPIVTAEFADVECSGSGGDDPANFDNQFMRWADAHGVSHLAWTWALPSTTPTCKDTLLLNPNGTPSVENGIAVQDHLAALASTTSTATAPSPPASIGPTAPAAPGSTVPVSPRSLPALTFRSERLWDRGRKITDVVRVPLASPARASWFRPAGSTRDRLACAAPHDVAELTSQSHFRQGAKPRRPMVTYSGGQRYAPMRVLLQISG